MSEERERLRKLAAEEFGPKFIYLNDTVDFAERAYAQGRADGRNEGLKDAQAVLDTETLGYRTVDEQIKLESFADRCIARIRALKKE